MLTDRIEILEQNKVISPSVGDFTRRAIEILSQTFPHVTEENAAGFLTHLAMAAERMTKDDFVPPLTDEAWAQTQTNLYFPAAGELLSQLLKISPVEFPFTERQYLLLYICVMLSDETTVAKERAYD